MHAKLTVDMWLARMQAADVSKLQNEVTMLRKKLAGTENTLAKQGNDLKGQITNLKSKLAQTERDLNDSQIQCAPEAACLALMHRVAAAKFNLAINSLAHFKRAAAAAGHLVLLARGHVAVLNRGFVVP